MQTYEPLMDQQLVISLFQHIHPLWFYGIIAITFFLIITISLWNFMLRRKVERVIKLNLENQKIILQHAKQAALGTLIGNISHQWREPLSNLSSINLMMMAYLEHNQTIDKALWYEKLKSVENTLDFMSQTMQNFLEFYKPSSQYDTFNVSQSIYQTLSIIETHILADNVHIEVQGDMNVEIYGIKNEFMQVWLNIINNALQAFHPERVEKRKIIITLSQEKITFCDNARGKIAENALTKGLGLSMCQTILEKYAQKLLICNTKEGVCVTILRKT